MKRKLRCLLSLILVVVLLFSSTSLVAANAPVTATETAAVRVSEVEALRQTNAETYLMSDGSYECVVYSGNKYYYDSANTLQRIDNSVVAAKTVSGKSQYKNAANMFDVTFSSSGVPQIGISYQGKSITFSPMNATSGRNDKISAAHSTITVGKIDNCAALDQLTETGSNTVAYKNAFAGTDLVYVLENEILKEYIILGGADSPNTFSFLFEMDGVTLQTIDGVTAFVDSNGETVFAFEQLFAVDAVGEVTEDLSYSFTPVKETSVIVTVTLDSAYLSAADRAFPVVIDPSVVISSVQTADTCVCSGFPNTNYYKAYQLRTGCDDDYGIRRSYIKFDIPASIPAVGIVEARLDIEKVSGKTPVMRAYMVVEAWSSSTLTWNNRPSYTGAYISPEATLRSAGTNWYSMNVTEIVQKWADGSYINYGFLLHDEYEASSDDWVTFYSSDASSPHKPELHIFYDDYDTMLLAYKETRNGAVVPRNEYFAPVQQLVEDNRTGKVYTQFYTSMNEADMIARMQATQLFFIHTHGTQNGFMLSSGNLLERTELQGVDLNNLSCALLLTCETGVGGYSANRVNNNTPINIVEQLVICGVETVIGFETITYVNDCNRFAEEFSELTMVDGKTVAQAIQDINYAQYMMDMGESAVIGGNANLNLTE